MRTLFLSTWFPFPPDNGSKIRVYHLLKALGAKHEVALLSFAYDTAKPGAAGDMMPFCSTILSVDRNPFKRSHAARALSHLSTIPLVTRPLPEMMEAARRILTGGPFDVVIASTQVMAGYALQAPRPATMVLEEHNSMTRWMEERYQEEESPVQRLRCWLSWKKTAHHEARVFRQFHLCTMVSDQDRQATLENMSGYRERVRVVPNGVDCQHHRPGLTQPHPAHLVYNGALTYDANYDAMRYFLAKIYPLIQAEVSGVTLTITGSTAGVDQTALALDESVRLIGNVDDIRFPVAEASVCVIPIRQGGGTRLKILEAMALGTPVVSTTKGAEGLTVTPGKEILLADEPSDFAAQVVRLLQDPTLRQQLAGHARRLVEERYDWSEIGQRFVDLVEDTATNQPLAEAGR